jgi:hypothetical protein
VRAVAGTGAKALGEVQRRSEDGGRGARGQGRLSRGRQE